MFHLSMAIASYRSFGFAITRIWPIQPDYLTRIDRSCLRLLHEATHAIVIACNFSRQDLQRDFPIQFRVLRQIDFTHSALADLRADFVTTEFCAGYNVHGGVHCLVKQCTETRDHKLDAEKDSAAILD